MALKIVFILASRADADKMFHLGTVHCLPIFGYFLTSILNEWGYIGLNVKENMIHVRVDEIDPKGEKWRR